MSHDTHAIPMLSINHWNGREGYQPRYLILHGTAGGYYAQDTAAWFRSTENNATLPPVSSNYVIGRDGVIVCVVEDEDAAYGNGVLSAGHEAWWSEAVNPNLLSISIEHCKEQSDNSDGLTREQQAASCGLVKRLCEKHGIPMRPADATGGITGHYSIDPVGRTYCPGAFDWAALWAFLGHTPQEEETRVSISLDTPGVSHFFGASGDFWKCTEAWNAAKGSMEPSSNGAVLGHGFLDVYRKFGNDALCGLTYLGLPLTNEIGILSGVNVQVCERAILVYDPKHILDTPPGSGSIYIMNLASHAGQSVLKKVFALVTHAQLDALTKQLNAQPDVQVQAKLAQAEARLQHIQELAAL